jgi:hypothetical protein
MGSFFSPPSIPKPSPSPPAPRPVMLPPPPAPPEPPKAPPEIDKTAEETEARQALLARKRGGRRSTIMTGPLGDTTGADSYKKKLLGD